MSEITYVRGPQVGGPSDEEEVGEDLSSGGEKRRVKFIRRVRLPAGTMGTLPAITALAPHTRCACLQVEVQIVVVAVGLPRQRQEEEEEALPAATHPGSCLLDRR